jgi:hypothetical protein
MLIQMNQAAHEASGISVQSLPTHTMGDLLPLWTLTGWQLTEQDVPLAAAARGERIRGMEYINCLLQVPSASHVVAFARISAFGDSGGRFYSSSSGSSTCCTR